jgi:hypothetical protein
MPRTRSVWLSLLLALSIPTVARAQDAQVQAVEAGSKLVKARKLPAHSATYVLYRGSGSGRVAMQEIRRELARVEREDEELLSLTWHTQAMGREIVDELLLDPETLTPRARVIPLPTGGFARLEIDGATVTASSPGPTARSPRAWMSASRRRSTTPRHPCSPRCP